MNTTVRNFVRPQGQIFFGDINIDAKKCTFSLAYAILAPRKRKLEYKNVSGTITPELKQWLTYVFDKKVKVMENDQPVYKMTGEKSTGFQIFLERKSLEFQPGILSTMTFKSDNFSEDYYQNPFKLVILNDKAILTLVNIAAKERTQEHNPTTGKVETHYTQRYFQVEGGGYRKSYVPKKNYCRLIVQQDKLMEVAQAAEAVASA